MGVLTDEDRYLAENIVYAAPLDHIFNVVSPDNFNPGFVEFCSNIEGTAGLAVDFVLDSPATKDKVDILGINPDEIIYAHASTNFDATLAPQGRQVFFWLIMLDWDKRGDEGEIDRKEAAIKRLAERVYPGFMSKVADARKMVILRMNGLLLKPAQSYPNRPEIKCPDVEGLYFVGDTVKGTGCSADIAFDSAINCADMILAR